MTICLEKEKTAANTVAVVVTYNRKILLLRCLSAIATQTRKPDKILIINNASTDGTQELLHTEGWLEHPDTELLTLNENAGGAGGFAAGLKHAIETGADWVWMMDDDAVPNPNALMTLLKRDLDPNNIYASTAISGQNLSWPMTPEGQSDNVVYQIKNIPKELYVDIVPFIGIMISKETTRQIGIPDPDFFLVADDVEYCFRARTHGAKIILISESLIQHPPSVWYSISLGYRYLHVLKLVPWKRYYEVRNRLLLNKQYITKKIGLYAIIGWLLRLTATLIYEDHRVQQILAYTGGLIDAISEKKGKRHTVWGL